MIVANLPSPTKRPGVEPALPPIEYGAIMSGTAISCLLPTKVRGEAYLDSGQGKEAAGEFQNILDHSGLVWNCWTGALGHLGVARANALQAKTSHGVDADAKPARVCALAVYTDFLTVWGMPKFATCLDRRR
jgi:hypothetical protein